MGIANGLGRRHLVAGAVAGGLAGAGSSAQAATPGQPVQLLRARALRVGDLVLGPQAQIVRLASVERLSSGRVRLRYTHPETGVATPFDPGADRTGYPARLRIVVLRRGVRESSVRLSAPSAPGHDVVDGGAP